LSLLRFLRKKPHEEQASREAAPPQHPKVLAEPPAETGADSTTARSRRRRGSRGGRGRTRKPADPKAETATKEAPAAAPARKPTQAAERKSSQVAERKAASRSARSSTRRRAPQKRPPLPAAKRELLVSVDVGEQRVAVLEDDRVAEVYLERPERRSIAGNIYLGTVDNVLPGMEAAFVEIGLEKNGFLFVDEIVVPELEGKRHGRKIQDLLTRGQQVLVQAVKDPMKSKGARLTTEISLPGRFVVFVPHGEGLGVSRRLPDDERVRLRDILKALDPPKGGVIVRTAAEGASAEDVERDLVFLQRLWKTIEARAKQSKAPALVYQEAELPLRVVRDLFTGDFERALVDHDRTMKRIVGYLKKTSPHMVERVTRYKDKPPLFESSGVDAEIRSTLSRRVDLPSGGYLVFDYAEAFTVIDVNTGRFVGSRSKSSGARLEDTITKNNLEAVKEVVRQLRLRDVGGIIVIDFIDMANPKNRATVEEALRNELERDRTKTYVVEISPLGLVEMTRQNVTDGPREILTRKCPTCGGDGIVLSETSAAVDAERRLRALAAGSKSKAFRIELAARVASILIGPGAERLMEIEEQTKRRFLIEAKEDVHNDHFLVLAEGTLEELAPEAPAVEGSQVELKLVEVGLHDPLAAVGKLDGYDVTVAGAAKLVGKKVKARIERVLDGTAYAVPVGGPKKAESPITAEAEAEKPTRKPAVRKSLAEAPAAEPPVAAEAEAEVEAEKPKPARKPRTRKPAAKAPAVEAIAAEPPVEEEEPEVVAEPAAEAAAAADGEEKPKKRTRRGSRGGRGRKKKPEGAVAAAENGETEEPPVATIHVPDLDLGRNGEGEPAPEDAVEAHGAEPSRVEGEQPAKKRTRRGSRGGRNRRKKTPAAGGEAAATTEADTPA
jgi:ribonuclease G